MRFVQITAGTGDFYCGNCVRDDVLVQALARQGHEALMIPLYLPMVTEGEPVEEGIPLFYGGVNVYLQQKSAFFRRTPRWADALFDSTLLLKWAAKRTAMTKAHDLGEMTLSTLLGEEGKQVKELERLVDWLAEYGKTEVVSLSNALLVGLARKIKEALGVPVVCTLQGEDWFLDELPQPYREQAWEMLADRAEDIDTFIAVSNYYGEVMRVRLGLPQGKIHTVYNGISLEGYSQSRKPPSGVVVGYLARMCKAKGLQELVRAFIQVRRRGRVNDVQLKVAGTMPLSDQPFVHSLKGELAEAGLADTVIFLPNLTRKEKIAFLESLSVLSVPATYGEAFGLYVIEAMAAGVPVVQPNHAAFPEILEATGGGILYDPANPDGLVEALENLLPDPDRIRVLGEKGRASVRDRFTMDRMATEVAEVLHRTCGLLGPLAHAV